MSHAVDTIPYPTGKNSNDVVRTEVKIIRLEEDGQNHQMAPVVMADDPKGGMWIAWEDKSSGSRIQHLDDTLSPDRPVISLKQYSIVGLYGHTDGSLAFSAGCTPEGNCAIFLCRMAANGKMIFETRLKGNGKEYYKKGGWWTLIDKTCSAVPIGFNGKRYGLLYVVCHFFDDGGIHQADEYLEVDANGKIDEKTRATWNASHSLWPSVVVGDGGKFYGVTGCDGFPISGILMANYSKRPVHEGLIWPRKSCFDGTRLGAAFRLKKGFGMGIATCTPREVEDLAKYSGKLYSDNRGEGPYPVFLRFDEKGKKARATYVTDGFIPDPPVTAARFGKNHVAVLWGRSPFADKGAVFGCFPTAGSILTDAGDVQIKPFEIKTSITWGSDATTLKNGDVVWGGIADEDWVGSDVNNPKNLYVARLHCVHCDYSVLELPALPVPKKPPAPGTLGSKPEKSKKR